MAVRNLSHLASLLTLRSEITYTLDQVKAHPLTQAYVPVFEGLRDHWSTVFAEELTLRDELSAVHARIFSVDLTLNNLANRVSKALLTLTWDDRSHPLYVAYFKKKSLGEFKRPVLGPQLEATKGWIPELKKSDHPALVALGAEVEAAVDLAEEAVATRTKLEAHSVFFRETGNRKKLFDKVNATRKLTHGELAKMRHETIGLPSTFADLFFRHSSGGSDSEPMTLEMVDETRAALKKQLAELDAIREALVEEAKKEEAKADAEKAAARAAVEELDRAAAAAVKRAAEAKAKLAAMTA